MGRTLRRAATLAGLLACAQVVGAGTARAAPVKQEFGVYLGPGPGGAAQVDQWAAFTGRPVQRVMDYLPDDSFAHIAEPDWLLKAYQNKPYKLEISVPLLANQPGVSLASCAKGAYNTTWRSLATKLVAYGRGASTVRPGWEMNGDWYRWSAVGQPEAFVGCFRQLVTTMRAVPGAKFDFTWCPNLGPGSMPAEHAYPGDAYVDTIGLDVYDFSWSVYPVPAGMTREQAGAQAWDWHLNGDHGLTFWSTFAAAHKKPLAFPEYGVAWRADGRAGGDNPAFIDRVFDFATTPANNVAYLNYFNAIGDAQHRYQVMASPTLFTQSAQRLVSRIQAATPSTTRRPTSRTVTPVRVVPVPRLRSFR